MLRLRKKEGQVIFEFDACLFQTLAEENGEAPPSMNTSILGLQELPDSSKIMH